MVQVYQQTRAATRRERSHVCSAQPQLATSRPKPCASVVAIGLTAWTVGASLRQLLFGYPTYRTYPNALEGKLVVSVPFVVRLGMGVHNVAQVAVGRAVAVVPTPTLMVTLKREAVPKRLAQTT